SIDADHRIARETVLVNEVHVVVLARAKIITWVTARKLLRALASIEKKPPSRKGVEDVHVLIEEYVTKKTGPVVGGQLHTGKSRNDQVATAIRMRLRNDTLDVGAELLNLQSKLLSLASKHTESIFMSYTHQQPAQPISLGNYLLSIADALSRDFERVLEAYSRINRSPLGAGAIAGSSYNLDRAYAAELLGFDGLVENSIDAVGSRDFLLETLALVSLVATDLARFAQDLISYSSADIGLLELPDEFTSTSSIMPQKKNPDPLEVVRARCAIAAGNSSTGLLLMHTLQTGYSLDYQELTPLVWKSIDTIQEAIRFLSRLVPSLKRGLPTTEKDGFEFTLATELANTISREASIPYREAYRMVGEAVGLAIGQEKKLSELGE
ncbi:MAG TPA: argininosuccinate lyase, partial [Candidatus Binatus sp.]|nr:argininosuccinate lyase [Candidatus Binatus sp.]